MGMETTIAVSEKAEVERSSENTGKEARGEAASEPDVLATAAKTRRISRRTLTALVLQLFIVGAMVTISLVAALAHGYHWPIPTAEEFAEFNFVGVGPQNPEPTFISVAFEVLAWSAFGVLARSQYYLTQLIVRHKDFRTLETLSKLVGDITMGISISIAVVAFLRSTEFVNLTLRTASIDVIAAISFILGFYHESTRGLLGSFRDRIAKSTGEARTEEG
jgi:hypothetical protein